MKATIEVECQKPRTVVDAIKPDATETKKFAASLSAGKESVCLLVEAQDISGLLAGINSYLTLIKTSIKNMEE